MSGCHSATNPKEGINLTTYAKVMSTGKVKAGKLSGDFWESINSTKPDKQMPPPPAAKLPQDQIDLIRLWIEQGAKDLTCNPGYGGCATANMSYVNDIRPIMTSSCTGCHSGSAPQGGIDLSTYAGLASMAQNGKLLGAIKHESGFVAMPPAGNGLSECSISKVQAWIDQGMLNN
jgi:cytochrome c5